MGSALAAAMGGAEAVPGRLVVTLLGDGELTQPGRYPGGSGRAAAVLGLPGCHLDFKAAGGYVLAPPSRVGGKPYRLLTRSGTADGTLNWAGLTWPPGWSDCAKATATAACTGPPAAPLNLARNTCSRTWP